MSFLFEFSRVLAPPQQPLRCEDVGRCAWRHSCWHFLSVSRCSPPRLGRAPCRAVRCACHSRPRGRRFSPAALPARPPLRRRRWLRRPSRRCCWAACSPCCARFFFGSSCGVGCGGRGGIPSRRGLRWPPSSSAARREHSRLPPRSTCTTIICSRPFTLPCPPGSRATARRAPCRLCGGCARRAMSTTNSTGCGTRPASIFCAACARRRR